MKLKKLNSSKEVMEFTRYECLSCGSTISVIEPKEEDTIICPCQKHKSIH